VYACLRIYLSHSAQRLGLGRHAASHCAQIDGLGYWDDDIKVTFGMDVCVCVCMYVCHVSLVSGRGVCLYGNESVRMPVLVSMHTCISRARKATMLE
jgi:hypothetical protein